MFRIVRKPNFVVELQGGPVIVNGEHCDAFVTYFYVYAPNEGDAGLTATKGLSDDFKAKNVSLLGGILVKSCRPIAKKEKVPRKTEVSFFRHAEFPHDFFEQLAKSFPGGRTERYPTD